jgi:nicotinamidase-related amidase
MQAGSSAALIVVDMLNPYDHEDAEALMDSVGSVVPVLQSLIDAAGDHGIEPIYVNDNYNDWSAGRPELIERAVCGAAPELVQPIVPGEDVPFVVKARHSIFYQTILEYLLRQEGLERVILADQVTEQCILYSALDAYVRHFDVVICERAVAHIHQDLADAAITMMKTNMRAKITSSVDETLALLQT